MEHLLAQSLLLFRCLDTKQILYITSCKYVKVTIFFVFGTYVTDIQVDNILLENCYLKQFACS